jgi:hypothetical protein
MWQALLLSQTQLTQGLGHLTTLPSLTGKIADILINFLPPKNLPPTNPTLAKPVTPISTSSPVKRGQTSPAVGFLLVFKLWGVVKNVLASSCLSNIAERILDAVLVKEYPLPEDERLQDAWSALCSDLVATSFSRAVTLVLRPLPPSNGSDESNFAVIGMNTRREVWRLVAESWKSSATGISWETGLQLLRAARG